MFKIFFVLMVLIVALSGCKSWGKSETRSGAARSKNENAVLSTILDESVGGSAGVVISRKMDALAQKMESDLGKVADVERVGEGIKLTFSTQLLFDSNRSELKETNKSDLKKLAETLNQNAETDMLIVGHTDDIGAEADNLKLSEQRANAVALQLIAGGVNSKRMQIQGWGESQPSVLNTTEANRSKNRRVEIAIFANDKMKKEAGM